MPHQAEILAVGTELLLGIFGLLCDLTMPGVIPCFYTLAFLDRKSVV